MQLVISALMIVTYTIYFCMYTMTKKQNVSPASGKCISMSLGMVSSTMIGLILRSDPYAVSWLILQFYRL